MKKKIASMMLAVVLLLGVVPSCPALAYAGGASSFDSGEKLSEIDKQWYNPDYPVSDATRVEDYSMGGKIKLKSPKKGTLRITCSRLDVGNYEFLVSTSKKFTKNTTKHYYPGAKGMKVKYGKDYSIRYTIKKLKPGKTYYVKARIAYYHFAEKRTESVLKYTKAKKIKIKK